jgi:hypothetical protein
MRSSLHQASAGSANCRAGFCHLEVRPSSVQAVVPVFQFSIRLIASLLSSASELSKDGINPKVSVAVAASLSATESPSRRLP